VSEQTECMCLQCGISLYLDAFSVVLEDPEDRETKLLRNVFCSECAGPLIVIGKADGEPRYRLE
jgi:hypothetical protein